MQGVCCSSAQISCKPRSELAMLALDIKAASGCKFLLPSLMSTGQLRVFLGSLQPGSSYKPLDTPVITLVV